jgi:hypothetical protein
MTLLGIEYFCYTDERVELLKPRPNPDIRCNANNET